MVDCGSNRGSNQGNPPYSLPLDIPQFASKEHIQFGLKAMDTVDRKSKLCLSGSCGLILPLAAVPVYAASGT
jgi:hypothetical protein